jgi:hypothetical protein
MKSRTAICALLFLEIPLTFVMGCSNTQIASLGDAGTIQASGVGGHGGSGTKSTQPSAAQSATAGGSTGGPAGGSAGGPPDDPGNEDLPSTFGTQCVDHALPEAPTPRQGEVSPWLGLPEFGPILRAISIRDAVLLLSPTGVTRVDPAAQTHCLMTGFPSGWVNRDLRRLTNHQVVLSIAPPDGPAALYLSADNGAKWTLASYPRGSSDSRGPSSLVVDESSATAYAFDLGDLALKSIDEGGTWSSLMGATESVSFSGAAAIDRSGILILMARNGGTGGCSLRMLDLAVDGPQWKDGALEFMLPCSGIVPDPTEDRAFYVFGSSRVSRVVIDSVGNATESATLSSGNLVINDLWADPERADHVRFTGIAGNTLAVYDAGGLAEAAPLAVEGGEALIGGAALPLVNGRFSIWAFAPSNVASHSTGFILGTE